EFPHNSEIAARMSETDWGREIKRSPATAHLACTPSRSRNAQLAAQKIGDQRIALGRKATERVVAAARNRDELRAGQLGYKPPTLVRLDLVVVAGAHEHRAADLAVHPFTDFELRRGFTCFHGLYHDGGGRFFGPRPALFYVV